MPIGPEHDAPPVGEEIHLPGPSLLPLLTAFGITLAIVSLTFSWILVAAGALLTVICIVRWVRSTSHDIAELPPEHH